MSPKTRTRNRTKSTITEKSVTKTKSDAKKIDLFDSLKAELIEVKKDKEKFNLKDIQKIKKNFKQTCDSQKRGTQLLDQTFNSKRRAGTTRSGAVRGVIKQSAYSNGQWVNKGIDDATEPFDIDEQKFLSDAIKKIKKVNELKYEHLKHLVIDVYLQDLKDIKTEKIDSSFHKRYKLLLQKGRSTTELYSEMYQSLFTNEQRDYIFGLLQGAFDTVTKDSKGDIKHNEIYYVNIVMLAEITIRIVKHVHQFESEVETLAFMRQSAREALGLDPDEYEDDDDDDDDDD